MNLKSVVVISTVLAAWSCALPAHGRAPTGKQKPKTNASVSGSSISKGSSGGTITLAGNLNSSVGLYLSGGTLQVANNNVYGGSLILNSSQLNSNFGAIASIIQPPQVVANFNSDGIINYADLQSLLTLVQAGHGSMAGNTTIANNGTLNLNDSSSSSGVWNTMATGGALNIISASSNGGVLYSQPNLADAYHVIDLGNFGDWLRNEYVGSFPAVLPAQGIGEMARVNYLLRDFQAISPAYQNPVQLASLLDTSGAGWSLTAEFGVDNTGGVAVGATAIDGSSHALLLSPVPEPTGIVLAGCGFLALLLARRRSR